MTWGACGFPFGPGTRPGFIVVKRKFPLSSVGIRPYPVKPSSSRSSRLSAGWAYLPCVSACQISISASGNGSPSPSSTRPAIVTRSPGTPGPDRSFRFNHARPMVKNGPTVCDGVAGRLISCLHRRGFAAAKDDVKSVAQRPFRYRAIPVEKANQPIARLLIGRTVEDWIVWKQRIAREIHLRDQARRKRRAKDREMDVCRPPGIVMIAPGIRARPDGQDRKSTRLNSSHLGI